MFEMPNLKRMRDSRLMEDWNPPKHNFCFPFSIFSTSILPPRSISHTASLRIHESQFHMNSTSPQHLLFTLSFSPPSFSRHLSLTRIRRRDLIRPAQEKQMICVEHLIIFGSLFPDRSEENISSLYISLLPGMEELDNYDNGRGVGWLDKRMGTVESCS